MSDPFYSSRAWRLVRRQYLVRHPLCEDCFAIGRTEAAAQVDHRTARKDGGAPFAFENLRALCAACHSRKTAHMDGAFGNARKARAPVPGCDVQGRPLDPAHAWNQAGAASNHGMPRAADRVRLVAEGSEGSELGETWD